MPTYDYKCPICGVNKEVFHGINDSPSIFCNGCLKLSYPVTSSLMQKMPSAGIGVQFKGTGFYETDYKGNDE